MCRRESARRGPTADHEIVRAGELQLLPLGAPASGGVTARRLLGDHSFPTARPAAGGQRLTVARLAVGQADQMKVAAPPAQQPLEPLPPLAAGERPQVVVAIA